MVSIVGKEVFSLALSLTPRATQGSAYADTSKSDGRLKLTLSCIQVVYLHKVFMSLLVSCGSKHHFSRLVFVQAASGLHHFEVFSSRTSPTTSRWPKRL